MFRKSCFRSPRSCITTPESYYFWSDPSAWQWSECCNSEATSNAYGTYSRVPAEGDHVRTVPPGGGTPARPIRPRAQGPASRLPRATTSGATPARGNGASAVTARQRATRTEPTPASPRRGTTCVLCRPREGPQPGRYVHAPRPCITTPESYYFWSDPSAWQWSECCNSEATSNAYGTYSRVPAEGDHVRTVPPGGPQPGRYVHAPRPCITTPESYYFWSDPSAWQWSECCNSEATSNAYGTYSRVPAEGDHVRTVPPGGPQPGRYVHAARHSIPANITILADVKTPILKSLIVDGRLWYSAINHLR